MLCLVLLCAPAPAAPKRVALVVGVAHYQHAPALENPLNDARGMDATLKRLGFEVETVTDPSRADLEAAIRRLGARAVGAEVALFHYSGHALEVGGRNWILPVSFNTNVEREMPFEAVDLATVIDQTTGSARVSLIFLDACRNNPFAPKLAGRGRGVESGGLAEVAISAAGMLIAFATAPGEIANDGTGANSPFTGALMKRLETPGTEIKTVMGRVIEDVASETGDRQRPWMTFTLKGDFYLTAPPPAGAAAPASAAKGPDADALFWQSIMASRDPADYKAYLERFPNGVFAALAKTRAAQAAQAPAPKALPPVAAFDRNGLIAQLLPRSSGPERAAHDAAFYLERTDHRALAVGPNAYAMRTGRDKLEDAEILSLEGCQVRSRQPCTLLARDGGWVPAPERDTPRPMPRASYDGVFDPKMIPIVPAAVRNRPDVKDYLAAKGPKAAAIFLATGVFVVATGATARAAEEAALSQCNAQADRKDASGGCFLYASVDKVVLPQRSQGPLSPAR